MNQVDIIRNILDVGSTSAKHVRMFLNVCVVLFQGEADTMHDTAVCLTVNSIDITDTSNEVNTGEFQNGSLTGLSINLNLARFRQYVNAGVGSPIPVFGSRRHRPGVVLVS